jgi:hypothetical protein
MIDCARRKAEAAGVADRIRFQVVPMESLSAVLGTEVFDGVYSNFGAVNCAPDLAALAGVLAPRLAPNAPLIWVIMGRFVPWEMGWYCCAVTVVARFADSAATEASGAV